MLLIICGLVGIYFGLTLVEKIRKEEESKKANEEGYEVYFDC